MTQAQIARVIRRVQELENDAADKAAVGFLLVDEAALTGSGAGEYAKGWTERLVKSIGSEAIEAARLGRSFLSSVADVKTGKSKIGSDQLTVFRAKVALLLTQYGERLKVFIAEAKVKGLDMARVKDQRSAEFSRWTLNRDALGKAVKREAAGFINSLFHAAYLDGFKG